MAFDIYEQKTTHIKNQNERLQNEIRKLEQEQSDTIPLIRNKTLTEEMGEKEIERLSSQIQEKKGYLMNEEKINKITEECWDFIKFFMNYADVIWEVGILEMKKDVQSLITPKGFVWKEKVIELKETPDFISSFGSEMSENQLRWSQRELIYTS
ncbi:MAG: hypothetical protein LBS38_00505 [Endomicrobium sp.]|nr:hypothetical protein [Endomicrobium sp.]